MKVFNNVIQQNGNVMSLSTNVNLKASEIYEAFSISNRNYLTNCEINIENKTNESIFVIYIIFNTTPTVTCTIKYEDKMEEISLVGTEAIIISNSPAGFVVKKVSLSNV